MNEEIAADLPSSRVSRSMEVDERRSSKDYEYSREAHLRKKIIIDNKGKAPSSNILDKIKNAPSTTAIGYKYGGWKNLLEDPYQLLIDA